MKSAPNTGWSPSQQNRLPRLSTPPLVQALTDYDRLQRRRFHVPAHAGFNLFPPEWDLARDPYRYDLTELEGLDVLSEPSECIADAQACVAEIFNVSQSYFLVNGATVGLMAAMLATVRPGEKVLVARNAHRSVLSGLILAGAEPVWLLPERLSEWELWGGIPIKAVEEQLALHPEIKALFITSPTYEGIGSDIPSIAALCREKGVYFIVDEAHGSLWPFSNGLPASATQAACDVVIHSMHKSGGSLTQSALAHLPHGSRIDPVAFQQALNTLQTTSPSYLLMASLEAACHMLISDTGQERITNLLQQVHGLRADLHANLNVFKLFEADFPLWDPCKLYFMNPRESGENWGPRFEEEVRIAYESASPYGVLYLAGLGLQPEDFQAFREAFVADDLRLRQQSGSNLLPLPAENPAILIPQTGLSPRDAFFAPGSRIPSIEAAGRIAKETIVHCPPGIPVLIPGERIQPAHLAFLPKEILVVR